MSVTTDMHAEIFDSLAASVPPQKKGTVIPKPP